MNAYIYPTSPAEEVDPLGLQKSSPNMNDVMCKNAGLPAWCKDSPPSKIGQIIADYNPASLVWDAGKGAGNFAENYFTMKNRQFALSDKYFHCKANCEAAKHGPGGYLAAVIISEGREITDKIKGDSDAACNADRIANAHGREGGAKNRNTATNCQTICNPYRPVYSPGKQQFPSNL
jgi:hypothetical protein